MFNNADEVDIIHSPYGETEPLFSYVIAESGDGRELLRSKSGVSHKFSSLIEDFTLAGGSTNCLTLYSTLHSTIWTNHKFYYIPVFFVTYGSKMLDKKDFEKIKNAIDRFDASRDTIIKQSRDVIKASKRVIYACHRNDLKDASKQAKDIKSLLTKLQATANDPKLKNQGSYKVAVQEYVEAITFYHLMKDNKIPTHTTLKVEPEHYLLGIIDLVGELVRKAINSAIREDYQTSVEMKDLVTELYNELLLFDFAGGELRKKFDSIKYDLKKLEDLILNLKLSGKI